MNRFLLLTLLIIFTSASKAQEYNGKNANALLPGTEKVILEEKTGQVKFASYTQFTAPLAPANASKWLVETLKITNGSDFEIINENRDKLGFTHIKYQQVFNHTN